MTDPDHTSQPTASAERGVLSRAGAVMRPRRPALAVTVPVAVVAIFGVGVFAVLGGFGTNTSRRVSGTGTEVVQVALVDALVGFDVDPDTLVVDSGTRVVLNVVNEGDEDHDLAVDGIGRTRMLRAGDSQKLDLGEVTEGFRAYCTLPGHKLAGMTLDIQVRPARS